MFNEYDHVRIVKTGVAGEIVDIHHGKDGCLWYIVQSDERGAPGGYGTEDSFKLYDCRAEDLEKL